MVAESVVQQRDNTLGAARGRIQIGPKPEWATPCSFRTDFKPKQAGHVTYLLCAKQFHAEKRALFCHTANRMDTIQGVQSVAEGKIAFDPETQSLTFHSIQIHRAGTAMDRTLMDHIRCVERATHGLDSSKRTSVSLLLEDVRPGDILELSYSIEDHPVLLSDNFGYFFSLPEGVPFGKFYFSVVYSETRRVQWRSSAHYLQPEETRANGEVCQIWTRDNFLGSHAEEYAPAWQISYPWVQVSDCPDWQTVSSAFAEAWNLDRFDADLATLIPELATAEGSTAQQIGRAVQFIQEQFRYVPGDGEIDGTPPVEPEVVARRRYGDTKDLSLLLMLALKRLGLETRLVLVNSEIRKSLSVLLPMPSIFNHLVVEYKTKGEIHWVDATAKGQGGSSFNRVLSDFGVGLPVAGADADLMLAPEPAEATNVYHVRESILLDTAGDSSIFGVVVMARGTHAEELRRQFEKLGPDAIARQRLQAIVDRFPDVKRVGTMEHRDDLAHNEFFLAETFEIKDFLKDGTQASWYKLEITAEAVAGLLPLPVSGVRQTPLGLPYPCQVIHSLEVYCVALPPAIVQQRSIENSWISFNRYRKTLAGYWTMTISLSTLTDAVPPAGVDEYREAVREVRQQSAWSLMIPAGQTRPFQRSDFAKIPASWDTAGGFVPRVSKPAAVARGGGVMPGPATSAGAQSAAPEVSDGEEAAATTVEPDTHRTGSRHRRRKRHRRRHKEDRKAAVIQAIFVALLVVVLMALAFQFFKRTGNFFQAPPVPDLTPQR